MRHQAGGVFINEDRNTGLTYLLEAYGKSGSHWSIHPELGLEDWRVVALETEFGEPIGGLAIKEHEAHIGILPRFRGKWRARQTIQALCDLFHIRYACVCRTKPLHALFLLRNGWRYSDINARGYFLIRK